MKSQDKAEQSVSNHAHDIDSHDTLHQATDRRTALQKIGKFSAYAAPAAIALLSSKAAHAS